MWSTAAAVATAALAVAARPVAAAPPAGYSGSPTFSEDFSGGLGARWHTTFAGWKGSAPATIMGYNAYVDGTEGVLRVQREASGFADSTAAADGSGGCNCGFGDVSSAVLKSTAKFGEGYYEATIKTDGASPFMAAFWLQGTKGEINVMEFVGAMKAAADQPAYWTNAHCFEESDGQTTATMKQPFAPGAGFTGPSAYHKFGVDWSKDTLSFYVDGAKVRSAKAACLVGEQMNIILSHETNPKFDGEETGFNANPSLLSKPELMRVQSVQHWGHSKRVASCASLGWPAVDNTCSARRMAGDCSQTDAMTTLAAAKQRCSDVGARLCSMAEVKRFGVDATFRKFLSDVAGHGSTACAKWGKWQKVWSSEDGTADGTGCAAGQAHIVNPNGREQCVDAATESGFGQCCLTNPDAVKAYCEDADEYTRGKYTRSTTINGETVCARSNFGVISTYTAAKKQCKYVTHGDAEQFCQAQGGDLCTLEMMQGDAREVKGKMVPGVVGNGVTKDDTAAYGQKRLSEAFWMKNDDLMENQDEGGCGTQKSAVWLKNSDAAFGEYKPFSRVADAATPNPTDVLCNTDKGNHDATKSERQRDIGYYRPYTKRQGYMRKNFEGKKIAKAYTCGYMGSPKQHMAKSRKLAVCCFKKK